MSIQSDNYVEGISGWKIEDDCRFKSWSDIQSEDPITSKLQNSKTPNGESSMIGIYQKKPAEVRALRFTGQNAHEVLVFMERELSLLARSADKTDRSGITIRIVVATGRGDMIAEPGDWIVQNKSGEFSVIEHEAFEATYERVVKGSWT